MSWMKESDHIQVSIAVMFTQAFIFAICSFIILEKSVTISYKTLADLKTRFKKIEKEDFTTSDVVVGKAMDFMYSNKTMMGLIAGELWNVGSRALDRIVEIKPKYKTASVQQVYGPE